MSDIINELLALDYNDNSSQIDLLLQLRNYFGVELGIISKIDGDLYTIKQVSATKEFDSIAVGLELELNNTYCNAVIQGTKTISYSHVGNDPEMNLHPVYQSFQLESYIGAPIFKNHKVVGTLNFSSPRIRKQAFNQEEINTIEQIAKKLNTIF